MFRTCLKPKAMEDQNPTFHKIKGFVLYVTIHYDAKLDVLLTYWTLYPLVVQLRLSLDTIITYTKSCLKFVYLKHRNFQPRRGGI